VLLNTEAVKARLATLPLPQILVLPVCHRRLAHIHFKKRLRHVCRVTCNQAALNNTTA